MLCRAGISDWSCISGFRMLIIQNTVDSRVESESIQRYFHLKYVISPDMPMKSEYHSLVSPMVRSGGLCRYIHSPTINTRKTILPAKLVATAIFDILFLIAEVTALIIHKITEAMVNI